MVNSGSETLNCTSCSAELSVPEVLQHCGASWPEHHLLYFTCPKCRDLRHIKVRDDHLAFGYLDGFPGPRFITQREVVVPGLSVRAEEYCIALALEGHGWIIDAKD